MTFYPSYTQELLAPDLGHRFTRHACHVLSDIECPFLLMQFT